MQHDSGFLTSSDGTRLHYQSWWPDSPPKGHVQVLHGLGDHSGMHRHLVDHLLAHGYAAHAIDLRGHGRSAGQRAYVRRWSDYRGDALALTDRLKYRNAVQQVTLIGSSMGALLALDLALAHPDRVNAVVAAAPPLGEVGVPPALMLLARIASRMLPRISLKTGMDLSGMAADPAVLEEVLADPLFHRVGTARLATELTEAAERVRTGIAWITVPALLLHGARDRLVLPRPTREAATRAPADLVRYIEYPDGYHALFADDTGPAVLRDVTDWLQRRLQETAA
ncbi:MAG TPA: alpha/beta hydrolase [Gemmatimonadales bacterium]|nr:alpha/beta hydrolase [Gemmatimonadales bacterium]